MVCQYVAKFGDHGIKGSDEYISRGLSRQVTILSSLVAMEALVLGI